jgi:hypothetical protein
MIDDDDDHHHHHDDNDGDNDNDNDDVHQAMVCIETSNRNWQLMADTKEVRTLSDLVWYT